MGMPASLTRVLCAFVIALITSLFFPSFGRATEPTERTFWVIPHTHWEGAVFKTRDEYLAMGLGNILKALQLLKTQPHYRFVLDQVAYVKPFLERFPDQEPAFRKFVAEGRLQLVLGMNIMPDVNMPGGESFVRQMLYGKDYYRQKFGVDVSVAWLIDTFGHHAQMPQILKQAGYRSFWFSRGVPRPDHPSEFLWQGIDGTRINAYWLPFSYGLLYGSPKEPSRFRDFVERRFEMLTPNSRGNDRVGLSGVDVSQPEEHLVPMVEEFNRQPGRRFTLRMGVPADFEAVIDKRKDLPVFKGEFNPIFQGTYSSRIELKAWMRTMERLLTDVEKTSVLAGGLGSTSSYVDLWRAWERVLFNETHDLASGVMTDHVYDDTLQSYQFSRRLGEQLMESNWESIAARVDTRGSGVPVIVLNTLGWPRTDIAEVTIEFADKGTTGLKLLDPKGEKVSTQLLETKRFPSGSLKEARLAFLARDVPALGYSVYHFVPMSDRGIGTRTAGPGAVLENELYRLKFDPETGALNSLRVKAGDWEALGGPGNVISRESDRGDLWELYRGLDGGSKIAITRKQPVPKPGQAVFSSEFRGEPGTGQSGPVFSEFSVSHPFGTGGYRSAVRLYSGLRRIEFSTTLRNQEKLVRYQALFPTTIRDGKNTHAVPFGAIERPLGIEFPAQDWVDYGDDVHGLTLINFGLPGNLVTDGTMMVSLSRSHTLGAYGFGGGYEPGMSSDSGLQLGKERTVRYALVPHGGDWRESGVYRDAMEFTHPLLCQKAGAHAGKLPKRWGFLEVGDSNVVVSALKPDGHGGAVLRVYEATGKHVAGAQVKFSLPVISVRECNLMEDLGAELRLVNNAIQFDLHPYQIRSFRLQIDKQ
jgi:alpha-mannosidase